MRVAITGGTGFVGRHLARALAEAGHEVVLVARGADRRDLSVLGRKGVSFFAADLSDATELARAFSACGGVAHCAGINREIGAQTYQRVHVQGTRRVVEAAMRAGVGKIALLSFLRARPGCGSPYHESKWAAEEIVRESGLDYTVLKSGMIFGAGDHMLDHVSRALRTFPIFPLVGMHDCRVRPVAVEDVVRILRASLVEGALSRQTVAVLGPEEMLLGEAVRRVARVIGRRTWMPRAPVALHRLLAWCFEKTMAIPLASRAQVQMLSEGMTEALPACDLLAEDLRPQTKFNDEQIRRGLPEEKFFRLRDCRRAA
jgi:NADH dehydrogenase